MIINKNRLLEDDSYEIPYLLGEISQNMSSAAIVVLDRIANNVDPGESDLG